MRVRRTQGLKTWLCMIELIDAFSHVRDKHYARLVSNFIHHLVDSCPAPMAIALVSYALKTGKLDGRRLMRDCRPAWQRFSEMAAPVLSELGKKSLSARLNRQSKHYGARIVHCKAQLDALASLVTEALAARNTPAVYALSLL